MKLVYTVTEPDVVAYAAHAYEHSAVIQKQLQSGRLILLVAVLLFAVIAGLLGIGGSCVQLGPLTHGLLIAAVILAAAVALVLVFHRRMYLWGSLKGFRSSQNKGILGPQTLAITETGITVTRPGGESTTYWRGIERVETSTNAAYVYISSMAAYIVPKCSVIEGDYEECVAEIRRRSGQTSA